MLSALARGGGGGGADAVPFQPIQSISGGRVLMLSPFSPFNQSVGGGGGSVPFRLIQSVGGGGGAVPFQLIQSVEGGVLSPFGPFNQWGGGAYMLTFIIRAPFSPKGGGGGGGGPWPPCPHSGDAHDWLCRPCLLGGCSAGALQALPMVLM